MKLIVLLICLWAYFDSVRTQYTDGEVDWEEGDAVAFARKMSHVPETDEDSSDVEKDDTACRGVFCKTGRVCEATTLGQARCVCGGDDFCEGHSRQVCGSDGKFYPSHCELHRVSCVKGSKLGVDHSNKKCAQISASGGNTTARIIPKLTTSVQPATVLQGTSEARDLHSTTKQTSPEKSAISKVCGPGDYNEFKKKLMNYQCERIGQVGCMSSERRKPIAVTEMFDFFDQDENKLLTLPEMEATSAKYKLERFSSSCGMKHLFIFDDIDEDDIINIEEFYRAFGVYDPELSDEPPVTFTTLVTVGNALELKCDLPGVEKVTWKRTGVVLEHSDEIKLFDDNSLYIGSLQLHHMGNYSCHDKSEDSLFQTHIIIVQMPPSVTVFPSLQIYPQGSMASLRCHVDSVPQSEISWTRDSKAISTELNKNHPIHFYLLENNTTLKVRANVSDSSEYSCEAENSAGTSKKSASLTFMDEPANKPEMSMELTERFLAFHSKGYTIYDLTKCNIEHNVDGDFQITLPSIATSLCGATCEWGGATLVGEELLYVNQPASKRVLVIEVVDRVNPLEVIRTDGTPMEISYLPHLDQVWLTLCGDEEYRGEGKCKKRVVKVINRAGRLVQHQAIDLKNGDDKHLQINRIFLPKGNNPLNERFNNGYYTVDAEIGVLMVLDLISMETLARVDLREHDCVPVDMAFVPIGGYLFVSCLRMAGSTEANSHLIMDYITRKVIIKSDIGGGSVYVSPDSRNVLILEENGNAFSVYKLTADGRLNHLFDEYTEMHLNHISFFESGKGYGYNSFAVSYKFNTILHLDLSVGKVTMIEGPEGLFSDKDVIWNKQNRKLAGGNLFMNKLVTSSMNTITGLDGKRKSIQCHWQGVSNSSDIFALPIEQGGLKY